MPSLNLVVLMGSLCDEPVLTTSRRGRPVLRFTLAVGRTPRQPPKKGEPNADFPVVLAYGETATQAYPFLQKGSVVAITGYWQSRNFRQDGKKRVAMEVVAEEINFVDNINWVAAVEEQLDEALLLVEANPEEGDDDGEG